MIRIVQGYSLADARDTAMFEGRRRLFVDLMRWDVPVVQGRFEIDQFDGPDAIYIAEYVDCADHRGSLRLLPSVGSHILGDLYPELCAGPVPRGLDVREITRLCLPALVGARERLRVRNRLIRPMVDHALAAGIRTLTGVVRPSFRDTILDMGWEASPLGPERRVDGMGLAVFRIEIENDTPSRLARTGIYTVTATDAAVA